MNRRLTTLCLVAAATLSGAMLVACDTGDGKSLQEYDPDDYPSQTVPPTSIAENSLDGLDDLGEAVPQPTDDILVPDEPAGVFQVFAPWTPGAAIDVRNTCDGEDIAPAVSWDSVPAGTTELALALVDDSAVSDGEPFVHWVIAGLDPGEIALVEGDVPAGSTQALNFFGDVGYGGPCPPPGDDAHLYRLTAFALDDSPEVTDSMPASEFLDAVSLVTIGTADLSGTYQR